jgi:hypothetical protein
VHWVSIFECDYISCAAVFLAWLGVSYVRFIYFIQPTLKWAKNTQLDKLSKLLSDYKRITGLFSQYAGLFGMNVLSAAMVRIADALFLLRFFVADFSRVPTSSHCALPIAQVFVGTIQTIGGKVDSQGA